MGGCFFKALYCAVWALGKPVGGIRPRRIYDILGRLAYTTPEFAWRRNRWGAELLLSPHYHIDRNIILFGTYDQELHLALEPLVQPGMTCMDVGANLGEMSLHMAQRAGAGGIVYAFEPAPPARERLKLHVERNGMQSRVRVFPLALGATTGRCRFAYPDPARDNQGLGSTVNFDASIVGVQEDIQCSTLDDFVREQKLARIDLIKIDIQGAEYGMLEGGRETLMGLGPDLLIEFSPADLKCAGRSSRDLCELIESFGYTVFLLKNGRPGRRIDAATMRPDFSATNVLCTKRILETGARL